MYWFNLFERKSLEEKIYLFFTWKTMKTTFYMIDDTWNNLCVIAGLCLFLKKDVSELDSYDCTHFRYGCPPSPYTGATVYKCKCQYHVQEYSCSNNELLTVYRKTIYLFSFYVRSNWNCFMFHLRQMRICLAIL